MDIIFLEPVFKDYIWGGYKLKNQLNKKSPFEKTAESWEISCNPNGICTVRDGELKGEKLSDIYADSSKKEAIFGTNCGKYTEFPILIKFIDAMNNLSIQVHPDDEYARQNGFPYGKNEMWYVMGCEENAKLIAGMSKVVSKEELKDIIENNQIKNYLNEVPVKTGDSVYIPAGTLHAIMSGLLICEIQQNSDITYRVYDWDRVGKDGKPRQLHQKEAIDTINSSYIPEILHDNGNQEQVLASNDLFEVKKLVCQGSLEGETSKATFEAYCVVKGNGMINGNQVQLGDSFIVPACFGKYEINGDLEVLKTTVK
ncbi:MAG: class I mannose-6-phosphate isomerase [Clostridia bacterium]|nr:class I mannose-6-phosphate isomerase [Clostridia bacterium]